MKSFKKNLSRAFKRLCADLRQYRLFIAALILCGAIAGLLFQKICILRIVTGYPCPGCGMTRAFWLLITLRWPEAFAMNPMIFVWAPLIVWAFVNRYFRAGKARPLTTLLIAAGLLSLAVYALRMAMLYPDAPPLTYDADNLLRRIKITLQTFLQ